MTPDEFKAVCKEYDSAPDDHAWDEGHPIFCLARENDFLKARLSGNGCVPLIHGKPKITNSMKAVCIGEFEIETTQTCSACFYGEPEVTCEVCGGEVEYQIRYDIPWDTIKSIYKMMATVALKDAADT